MAPTSLAIIGTAGRKDDAVRLTSHHYERMINACSTFINHFQIDTKTVKGISGGAAWADHLMVTLGLMGIIKPENITLYLPCELDRLAYRGETIKEWKIANTINYYHEKFSAVMGFDSLKQLNELYELGAKFDYGDGDFFMRNTHVASSVSPGGAILAFTFGSTTNQKPWTIREFDTSVKAVDAGLKKGGTADTWNKAICNKYHCLLGEIHEPDDHDTEA